VLVRAVGAEDLATVEEFAGGAVDRIAAHGCRRPVRVSLPAGRMGESLPVRGVAVREEAEAQQAERTGAIQLFDTPQYSYRVFVTNLDAPIDAVVGFYRQRRGGELDQRSQQRCGLGGASSGRWSMNCVHFQLAMLAYNLNCWLMLFNREEQAKTEDLRHTTLATARLRFLFLAAKIVRHAGAVLVRYSDHYAEQGTMTRLMDRLRLIVLNGNRFAPVLRRPFGYEHPRA